MKSNRNVLVLMAASSILLAGCCGPRHAGSWEYKVAVVPQTPDEAKAMTAPSLENREKYLNTLGSEGWILVAEDQTVFYLKRPKR